MMSDLTLIELPHILEKCGVIRSATTAALSTLAEASTIIFRVLVSYLQALAGLRMSQGRNMGKEIGEQKTIEWCDINACRLFEDYSLRSDLCLGMNVLPCYFE